MQDELAQTLNDALAITDTVGLQVLLIGAWARDLCLPEDVRRTPRKTNDADLAVIVDDWEVVDQLFERATTTFHVTPAELHMRHHVTKIKVDIVPCGRIETPQGELHLRKSSRVLTTIGLAESFGSGRVHPVRSRQVLVP